MINKSGEFYNESSERILKMLIDNNRHVDAVITDIPYGVTKNKIDVFPSEYFLKNIWKVTDVFITTVQGKAMLKLLNSLPKNIKWYDLVWDKQMTTGQLNAKKVPLRQHENIIIMYKTKATYNPQMWDSGKFYNARKGEFSYGKENIKNQNYGKMKKHVQVNTTMRYPTSILKFKKPHPSIAQHATQKPTSLYTNIIKTYSNENDLIWDPYSGSGTTGVSCKETNRRFLGNEKNGYYYALARKRIEESNNG